MYKIYFISGHRKITDEEFKKFYIPEIDKAIEKESVFVIGDYYGVDQKSQDYLKKKNYDEESVLIYHMFNEPRYCVWSNKIGGFKSDEERDSAMTFASTNDIVWVRPGKENSGTAQNIARRLMSELMVDINDKFSYFDRETYHKKNKFSEFFQIMQNHLREEWDKLSNKYIKDDLEN